MFRAKASAVMNDALKAASFVGSANNAVASIWNNVLNAFLMNCPAFSGNLPGGGGIGRLGSMHCWIEAA